MNSTGERENRVNQIYAAWAKRHGMHYNILAMLYTTYKNDQCSLKFIGKCEAPMPEPTAEELAEQGKQREQQNYIGTI